MKNASQSITDQQAQSAFKRRLVSQLLNAVDKSIQAADEAKRARDELLDLVGEKAEVSP